VAQAIDTDGLQFFNLSHRWGGYNMPEWPSGMAHMAISRLRFHAMHGTYVQQWEGIMHRGTHMDAPIHVTANLPYINAYEPWRFFGTGVAVSIPKGKWGVVGAEDLENARPRIEPGDIVMINTGSHHNWGDNDDYFGYSPGLYRDGAEWLVRRGVKMVGVDVQALDHPLGTKIAPHGTGPSLPHLVEEYKRETGRDVLEDFPDWEISHKTLLPAGIPGLENVGGDLDEVTGKRCTFMVFPWNYRDGEASLVRVVAVIDPEQRFRIPTGERA
jgi:kynurenine formamidase